jgi:hypothetical protein
MGSGSSLRMRYVWADERWAVYCVTESLLISPWWG